jgi:hypothetical protein
MTGSANTVKLQLGLVEAFNVVTSFEPSDHTYCAYEILNPLTFECRGPYGKECFKEDYQLRPQKVTITPTQQGYSFKCRAGCFYPRLGEPDNGPLVCDGDIGLHLIGQARKITKPYGLEETRTNYACNPRGLCPIVGAFIQHISNVAPTKKVDVQG